MAFCYKKLWKLLIDRDMTRADLRKAIGANVLARTCETLNCNIGDVMDYVPELHNSQANDIRTKRERTR